MSSLNAMSMSLCSSRLTRFVMNDAFEHDHAANGEVVPWSHVFTSRACTSTGASQSRRKVMRWDRVKTGVVSLAVAVAAVTSAAAQGGMRPASIGAFGWMIGHEPVRCDLASEFATGALLGTARSGRRSADARRRFRDGADISI